jgi:hypothetical protein
MLAHPILPELLVSPCLDLLQKASHDDAEFITITLEVIQAISQSSALGNSVKVSNEVLQAMFMRLVVCNGLLERVRWVRRCLSYCIIEHKEGYTDGLIG